MLIKNLYLYKNGSASIQTMVKPKSGEYTAMYRLIADEGKELVKDTIRTTCIDIAVSDKNNWKEETAVEIERPMPTEMVD